MREAIYEATVRYKRNNESPYSEYFNIGFFTKKEEANKALEVSKGLPGFRNLDDSCFYINIFYLNDCQHIGEKVDFDIKNNCLYGIWYDYEPEEYSTISGYIGIYTKEIYAEKALEWYKTWDIFIVNGIDGLGISPIELNESLWKEGFVTVYD